MEPLDFQEGWAEGGAITQTGGPTHKLGGNLDWFLHSFPLAMGSAIGQVVAGTDHTGVMTTLKADQHDTLGYRMVAPAGFRPEALDKVIARNAIHIGAVPTVWDTWTREAEQWLIQQTGDRTKGNTGRGKEPRFRKQTSSRPQVGSFAYGANVAMLRLRKREGQENKLGTLIAAGKGKTLNPGTFG